MWQQQTSHLFLHLLQRQTTNKKSEDGLFSIKANSERGDRNYQNNKKKQKRKWPPLFCSLFPRGGASLADIEMAARSNSLPPFLTTSLPVATPTTLRRKPVVRSRRRGNFCECRGNCPEMRPSLAAHRVHSNTPCRSPLALDIDPLHETCC